MRRGTIFAAALAASAIAGTATAADDSGPPVLKAAPSVSGAPQAGQQVNAVPGDWGGAAPIGFTYQWFSCTSSGDGCFAIARATGQSYGVATDHIGRRLRVKVTATNAAGTKTATSAATPAVSGVPTGPRAVKGTRGNDLLQGTPLDESFHAGEGSDRIEAEGGDDVLWGGGDNDVLRGGAGGDRLEGGDGTDKLDAWSGNDDLRGGPGNDHLIPGSGGDSAWGGSGDDRIDAKDGEADRVMCGPGRDTVTADNGDFVHKDCETVTLG